jgi:hypothetical protein
MPCCPGTRKERRTPASQALAPSVQGVDHRIAPRVATSLPQDARLALRPDHLFSPPDDRERGNPAFAFRLSHPTDIGATLADQPYAMLELASRYQLHVHLFSDEQLVLRQQIPGRQGGLDEVGQVHDLNHSQAGIHIGGQTIVYSLRDTLG